MTPSDLLDHEIKHQTKLFRSALKQAFENPGRAEQAFAHATARFGVDRAVPLLLDRPDAFGKVRPDADSHLIAAAKSGSAAHTLLSEKTALSRFMEGSTGEEIPVQRAIEYSKMAERWEILAQARQPLQTEILQAKTVLAEIAFQEKAAANTRGAFRNDLARLFEQPDKVLARFLVAANNAPEPALQTLREEPEKLGRLNRSLQSQAPGKTRTSDRGAEPETLFPRIYQRIVEIRKELKTVVTRGFEKASSSRELQQLARHLSPRTAELGQSMLRTQGALSKPTTWRSPSGKIISGRENVARAANALIRNNRARLDSITSIFQSIGSPHALRARALKITMELPKQGLMKVVAAVPVMGKFAAAAQKAIEMAKKVGRGFELSVGLVDRDKG